MTDNRTDSQNTQPHQQEKKAPEYTNNTNQTRTQTVASTNREVNAASKTPEAIQPKVTQSKPIQKVPPAPAPQMKKVDISIAGITYPINCPIHEEEELRSAVYYINNFALDLKTNAPNIAQENLLVLTCLNLYEQINIHKKADNDKRQGSKQAEALLNKVMSDAQSIL